MNSLEVKFILEACRAGDLDPDDPKIAEAIQAMDADPALGDWWAANQEFDRAVVRKLMAVPVPEGLAERIHAGRQATAASRKLNRRQWLALAASVVALGALGSVWLLRPRQGDLADFRVDMADFIDRGWDHTFDFEESDVASIQAWLKEKGIQRQVEVPANLVSSRTLGCKTFRWKANRVTLICFSPRSTRTLVHFLIIDSGAIRSLPGEQPQFAQLASWNSAAWSIGAKTYLAMTTADVTQLQQCL